MDKRPAVSVILPTYNQARFLPECLDALERQTFRDFRVVACDDGSTDGTMDALAFRVKWTRHTENKGTAEAINTAKWVADRGGESQYVTWVSSDNLMAPNWLETLVAAMGPNVGAVYSAYTREGDGRSEVIRPGGYDPYRLISSEACYFGPSFLIRADVWQPHRGRVSHDYDNWLRVEEACWAKGLSIDYIAHDLCTYRVGDWCTGRVRSKEYDAPRWRAEAIKRRCATPATTAAI